MHSFSDDDENEYASTEESAEDVLEEMEEQAAEEEAEEDAVDTVLSNAIERIEEANVWKLLISQDVIAPGSASTRVVKSVNSQLKKFGLNRLEILLGMKDLQVEKPVQVQQQFDPDEARALRILAAKVLGRSIASVITSDSSPKLNTVSVQEERSEPRLQKVSAPQQPKLNRQEAPPKQKTAVERAGNQLKVATKTSKRTNVPEDAKADKGYALPNLTTTNKPRPMPNMQQQMAAYGMGAAQPMNISVDRSAKGGDTSKGASVLSQVIGQLTGGHTIAVDTSAPDGAGENVNERF